MNPPKLYDRKLLLENLLSKMDFDFEFLSIDDDKELSCEGLKRNHDRNRARDSFGRDFTRGEIASTLNHLYAYRKFINSGEDCAIILEDDVIFDDNTFTFILSSLFKKSIFNKNAQIILLTKVNSYIKAGAVTIDKDHKIVRVVNALGAQAYLINRLAAKKVLKINEKSWILCDDWVRLRRYAKIKIRSVFPPVAKSNTNFASALVQDRSKATRNQKTLKYIITSLGYKLISWSVRYFWQKPFRGYTKT